MAEFIITSDSTVDLGANRMEEMGVPYATLAYNYQNKEYPDDMSEASAKRIYDAMREGEVITTSQANVEAFLDIWKPALDAGKDILYIGFSSGLSGTVNSALAAAKQLGEEYPERRIEVVDSLCASGGEGMLLQHTLLRQKQGASLSDCLRYAEDNKLNVNHWYTVSELSYLRRGGRVGAVAATFADILNIKPVMNMDDLGHLIPREKVKGRKGSFKRIVEHMQESVVLAENPFFHITHADCLEDAKYLRDLIQAIWPDIPVHISMVGAVIGAHCGPGTVALFFMGKPRTR